jgi:hydrogenase maturation factor
VRGSTSPEGYVAFLFDPQLSTIARRETAAICRYYAIEPLGLIGSGALLVVAPPRRVPALLRAWARLGISGGVIGSVEPGRGVRAMREGRRVPFPWVVREIIPALARRSSGNQTGSMRR